MTRPAVSSRLFALILAGGSFLPMTAPAVADEALATAVAPAAAPPGLARLNIAPLRLEFDAATPAATLRLTNTSERPIPVQTRLFGWSQEGGEDHFAPSAALTISPSIVNIPPGATQIVRLLRIAAVSPGEKRFRLAVDQLPDPAAAQSGAAEARLRFTIPVFLDRDTAVPAKLDWKIGPAGVEVSNNGGATARIVAIEVKAASGKPLPVERNSLRYVQGGAAIAWPLSNACAAGPVTITAQVDERSASAQVAPSCG